MLAVTNPFVKAYPNQGSRPCLVWLTREDQYVDGRDGGKVIGSHYLLMLHRPDGTVWKHLELNVLNRMHRRRECNAGPSVLG